MYLFDLLLVCSKMCSVRVPVLNTMFSLGVIVRLISNPHFVLPDGDGRFEEKDFSNH